MLLLLTSVAFAEDCLPVRSWIDRAAIDVTTGDTAVIRATLEKAMASMRCTPPTAEELADWWLYMGAVRHYEQDPTVSRAFAAAKLLAPGRFDDNLGPRMRALWEAAAPEAGTAELTLDTNLDRVWIDTVHVDSWPVVVPAGERYLEVRDHAGVPAWNTTIHAEPGGAALVTTSLPELPKPERVRRSGPAWLASGLATAAAAGGAFAGAWAVSHDVRTAPDLDALERSNNLMHGLSWTGVGLGGAAVVLVGVGVVSW
jgi:hypothetical protein